MRILPGIEEGKAKGPQPPNARKVMCERLGPMGRAAVQARARDDTPPDPVYLELGSPEQRTRVTKLARKSHGAAVACNRSLPQVKTQDPMQELAGLAGPDFDSVQLAPRHAGAGLSGGVATPKGRVLWMTATVTQHPDGHQPLILSALAVQTLPGRQAAGCRHKPG